MEAQILIAFNAESDEFLCIREIKGYDIEAADQL